MWFPKIRFFGLIFTSAIFWAIFHTSIMFLRKLVICWEFYTLFSTKILQIGQTALAFGHLIFRVEFFIACNLRLIFPSGFLPIVGLRPSFWRKASFCRGSPSEIPALLARIFKSLELEIFLWGKILISEIGGPVIAFGNNFLRLVLLKLRDLLHILLQPDQIRLENLRLFLPGLLFLPGQRPARFQRIIPNQRL